MKHRSKPLSQLSQMFTSLTMAQRSRQSSEHWVFLRSTLNWDEATSHLDAVNERLVRDALDALKSDHTTLVIAHRLSTMRDADAIIALECRTSRGNGNA
jgi:ABC-type protease/lipase transport system fused ATPase/permease subunit